MDPTLKYLTREHRWFTNRATLWADQWNMTAVRIDPFPTFWNP